MSHILYKKGDKDIPEQILDRNGDIVLGCCKICGAVEIQLSKSPTCNEFNAYKRQKKDGALPR